MCIPPFGARQRLDKHVPAATGTHNHRRIVGRVTFYEWGCLCIPQSLLDNMSVKMFPRQQRVVGSVVFYAVRVVSKSRLVLPRNSCYSFILPSLSLSIFYVIKSKITVQFACISTLYYIYYINTYYRVYKVACTLWAV
jgi:hypothetical protein